MSLTNKNSLELIMLIDFYHLKKAKVTYIIHGIRVLKISYKLVFLGIAGIIHAFLPFIFLETVSKGVEKVADEMSHF